MEGQARLEHGWSRRDNGSNPSISAVARLQGSDDLEGYLTRGQRRLETGRHALACGV